MTSVERACVSSALFVTKAATLIVVKKGFLWAWYFWFTGNSCPLSFNRPLIPQFRLSLLFLINEKGQIIQIIDAIPKRKLPVTNFDNNSFETLTKHNWYNRGTIWRSFSLCVHGSGIPFSPFSNSNVDRGKKEIDETELRVTSGTEARTRIP